MEPPVFLCPAIPAATPAACPRDSAASSRRPTGTGRFEGIAGTTSYVISTDGKTGATTVHVTGLISLGDEGRHCGRGEDRDDSEAETRVVPFKVTGGGTAPQGILLVPGGTVPHNATGTASHVGKYTGEGMFTFLSFTSPTTGTFKGSFVFVAATGGPGLIPPYKNRFDRERSLGSRSGAVRRFRPLPGGLDATRGHGAI